VAAFVTRALEDPLDHSEGVDDYDIALQVFRSNTVMTNRASVRVFVNIYDALLAEAILGS